MVYVTPAIVIVFVSPAPEKSSSVSRDRVLETCQENNVQANREMVEEALQEIIAQFDRRIAEIQGRDTGGIDTTIQGAQDFIDSADTTGTIDEAAVQRNVGFIYNIFFACGMVIAVVCGVCLGIKFMVSSTEGKAEVKELVKRFVEVEGDNPALILDNSEWINPESYVDFMRNIGGHFNVNKMLATDCYKNRLEQGGLTFLEMGYMLMQAYDFVYLNEKYGCTLEIGGSDQWANMVAGVDLARKMDFMNGKEDREYLCE